MAKDWSYAISVTHKMHRTALPSKATQIKSRVFLFPTVFFLHFPTPFLLFFSLLSETGLYVLASYVPASQLKLFIIVLERQRLSIWSQNAGNSRRKTNKNKKTTTTAKSFQSQEKKQLYGKETSKNNQNNLNVCAAFQLLIQFLHPLFY